MRENNSINLIAIFLYIIIIILISSIIFLGVHIYKEEYNKRKQELVNIDEIDIQETVITTKLPEDNETIEVVSIAPAEIETSNNVENNIDKFYYNQLDDYSKLIYNSLNEQKENLKTGTSTISISKDLGELLKTEEGIKEVEVIFSVAMNAFEYDNPDVFYIDTSKMALYYESDSLGNYNIYIKSYNENDNYLIAGFNNKEDIDKAQEQIDIIIQELKNNTDNLKNDYEKIKYIHDWIVKNTKYDETLSRNNRNNIYGLIIEKNATCGGYAKTFKYIMDKLNINSIIIQGKAEQKETSEYHAWNYIHLNSNWYGIDCTWDDPVIQGVSEDNKKIYYDYFLKGQTTFDKHTRFNTFYGTDLKINYPELSLNDY